MITKMTPAPQATPLMSRTREKLGILKLRKSFILNGGKGGLLILIINKLWFLDSYLLKYTLNIFYSAMHSSSHGTIVKNKTDFHSGKQQQQKKKKRERERERGGGRRKKREESSSFCKVSADFSPFPTLYCNNR